VTPRQAEVVRIRRHDGVAKPTTQKALDPMEGEADSVEGEDAQTGGRHVGSDRPLVTRRPTDDKHTRGGDQILREAEDGGGQGKRRP
jgi:hypothetical protein